MPRESMSAVTAGSPHNSIARGRSSICHGRATRRSVLNFSVSVMITAENGPIPALHSDTGASGTGSSNPACSSRESPANSVINASLRPLRRHMRCRADEAGPAYDRDFRGSGVSWLWTAHLISASKRTRLGDWPKRRGRTIWKKCSAAWRETSTRPPKVSRLVRRRCPYSTTATLPDAATLQYERRAEEEHGCGFRNRRLRNNADNSSWQLIADKVIRDN